MNLITLTTDFGTADAYVAIMKGVIAGVAPKARVIDVTHDVPPYGIRDAAHVLRCLRPWYPSGTVHVCVVDPGVGTDRRILLARCAGSFFLVPDNGVITFVHRDAPIEALHVVENRQYFLSAVSRTFHGRDIFAPVAARLASGVKPESFGRATDRLELLPEEWNVVLTREGVAGRVIRADRFGSLITNIHAKDLGPLIHRPQQTEVRVNDASIGPLRATYADIPPGEMLALIGSSGFLEVAVNRGSAAARFGDLETLRIRVLRVGGGD
ncbi:MAG: SAM-dependent chlorinase/fluorinase [Phycisphaerae bacterium]|nr:MAG: hypothetical protein EDS66_11590 [Planctomycetota bacterium]KAB2948904.1 MAG: SAM-dependent chlorinase/fluorinase [Phycisphaerae bacterium]MBE7457941.1 SAM-dependent chlorinase/fluorinase [Planctomycetia bacterium]MCK6465544.1 SAM-dependent chlorinase/fluorinase [Phycisphaerae bacterium]MCL4719847.1 SAM-dependent chlorinase/fluorinase [Phycisphaerae bacterium]